MHTQAAKSKKHPGCRYIINCKYTARCTPQQKGGVQDKARNIKKKTVNLTGFQHSNKGAEKLINQQIRLHIPTFTHVHTHTHTYTHTQTHTHTHMYIQTHVRRNVHTTIQTRMRTHEHTHAHAHTYTHAHTQIHTKTHTHAHT